MAELNRAGRYDRMADGVERVTGRPAVSVQEFVSLYAGEFGGACVAARRTDRKRDEAAPRQLQSEVAEFLCADAN